MAVSRPVESLVDQAEVTIRNAILTGEFRPGARLAIPVVASRFQTGLTPVREALSRLVSIGLVTLTDNKGFRVAPTSYADLLEITETRCAVELMALRLSMQKRLAEWEDRVVAAIHRYRRVVQAGGDVSGDGHAEYDQAHRAFHVALISGCGLRRLIDFQGSLYDQAYRYRRLMFSGGFDPDRALGEHQKLADLVLDGKEDAACEALADHLRLTLAHVYPDDLSRQV